MAGERLPSSRVLCGDLGVSRGVVSDAYMQLAAEGWLVVAPRSGPRVAAVPRATATVAPEAADVAPVRYDLRPGRPDLASFPRAEWLRSLAAAVRGAGDAELDYPLTAGSLRLRTVLAAYRGRVRGTLATAHDIVVCLGAAQAFITVCDALAPARIAVEEPGHASIRGLLVRRGLEPVPTRVDEEGIVVAELPDDARAVLVTPAHQFPTGVVLSAERRAEPLRWADERDAIVLQDDYDAQDRHDPPPPGGPRGAPPGPLV